MPYPSRILDDDEGELLPMRQENQQNVNASGNVVVIALFVFIPVMYILIALTCKGVL